MGPNRDVGSQFNGDQGASFAGRGFADGKIISDGQTYPLGETQSADGAMPFLDGMNYVVQNTSEAFWRMDKEFKFTYTNPACEKVSGGFKSEDLMGKSLLEFLAPESIDQLQLIHGGRHKDEKQGVKTDVLYYELQMKRKSGGYFWAGISASPIRDMRGEVVGYQGLLKDVSAFRRYETEYKKVDGLLKKAEKMATLGRMTGVVAHEMNNVMAGILGFSELMMMQNEPENDDRHEHLKNIIGFSERIVAILQDVMTLARKDDDSRKLINLNDMIRFLLLKPELQKLTGQSSGVSVKLDMESSLHDIMVSYASLEKALLNLLTVSFLQAGAGGRVSISTKTVYLGRPTGGDEDIKEGEYVVLSVSDTGDGITEEDAGQIFEPFYVRKTMKQRATGLELTVAREVVKEHEGFIDVRSRIGCGSTFTVYLPVLRGEMLMNRNLMSQADYAEGQAGIH